MTEENFEETQIENQDSLNPDEEINLEEENDTPESGEGEDVETLKAELAKTKELNSKLYARLKKTEQKKPTDTVKDSKSKSSLTREEAILFAKGHTEEEVDLATKLAKVNGISILSASEDSYFKAKVLERLKKEKSEKASLGASNGSNKFIPKEVGKMDRDEHIKLFHEVMSKV